MPAGNRTARYRDEQQWPNWTQVRLEGCDVRWNIETGVDRAREGGNDDPNDRSNNSQEHEPEAGVVYRLGKAPDR